jgi:hypothetical protein
MNADVVVSNITVFICAFLISLRLKLNLALDPAGTKIPVPFGPSFSLFACVIPIMVT